MFNAKMRKEVKITLSIIIIIGLIVAGIISYLSSNNVLKIVNDKSSDVLGAFLSKALQLAKPAHNFTYEVISGALPPGLTLNRENGSIAGKPTNWGKYTATIKATDDNGCSNQSEYNFSIFDCSRAQSSYTISYSYQGVHVSCYRQFAIIGYDEYGNPIEREIEPIIIDSDSVTGSDAFTLSDAGFDWDGRSWTYSGDKGSAVMTCTDRNCYMGSCGWYIHISPNDPTLNGDYATYGLEGWSSEPNIKDYGGNLDGGDSDRSGRGACEGWGRARTWTTSLSIS